MILPYSSKCGFHAIAAQDIPKFTILCEYVGNVERLGIEKIDNDSVMELLNKVGPDSLVIVPRNSANIGRFFNCVTSGRHANLNTIRCWVKSNLMTNEVRVFIYTSKSIKKGEQMVFDYN